IGCFLTSMMLVAREEGLHTCPQAAFANYHMVIRKELGVPDEEIVLCGMALGHADTADTPNMLVPGRAALPEFSTWFTS
ncbi:MAG: nitroreductase family protein, partial [Rhodospirillales bacterium]|nr:nitroreductase family protein [Rhodospirillales bacterium]